MKRLPWFKAVSEARRLASGRSFVRLARECRHPLGEHEIVVTRERLVAPGVIVIWGEHPADCAVCQRKELARTTYEVSCVACRATARVPHGVAPTAHLQGWQTAGRWDHYLRREEVLCPACVTARAAADKKVVCAGCRAEATATAAEDGWEIYPPPVAPPWTRYGMCPACLEARQARRAAREAAYQAKQAAYEQRLRDLAPHVAIVAELYSAGEYVMADAYLEDATRAHGYDVVEALWQAHGVSYAALSDAVHKARWADEDGRARAQAAVADAMARGDYGRAWTFASTWGIVSPELAAAISPDDSEPYKYAIGLGNPD